MAFLSRGFKNLQWYSMTKRNPVISVITGPFLCLFEGVYPIIYPLQKFYPILGAGNGLDELLHAACTFLLHLVSHMAVNIQRESGGGVP